MLQEFPAEQPAQYINWVSFAGGLVKARLLADYKAAPDRDNKLNVQVSMMNRGANLWNEWLLLLRRSTCL